MTVRRSNNRLMNNLIPALIVLSLVVLIAVTSGPAHTRPAEARPNATTITLSPATIAGCDTVTVTVMVNDVAGLYGADVRLAFDPAALEVVDANTSKTGIQVLNGGFLVSPFILYDTADNTAGTIRFTATQLNPTPAVTGTGSLVNILFRAKLSGTTPLTFTFTQLANRNGQTIGATASNGSLNSIAPLTPTLGIAKANSTDARLTWNTATGVANYQIYRGTTPYFTPTDPPYATTTALIYTDTNVLGSTTTNYYYVIRSACASGFQSNNSNRVGEYDYPLRAVSAANYNDIALVLNVPGVNDAASLATYIGSSVRRISRYNASTQSFQTYVVGDTDTNFSLTVGQFAFVVTDNTAPASTALIGDVPGPGTVSFTLVSGTPAKYNFLSLPLDRSDLTTASSVGSDVGTGVARVVRYRTETQSFQVYVLGDSDTDFPLAIGEPFGLVLTPGARTNWP